MTSFSRCRVVVSILLLAFISSATSTTPTNASGKPAELIDVDSINLLLQPSIEDREFAVFASRDTGVPTEFIEKQNGLVFLANEVARVFPDEYASARLEEGNLVIAFRDAVPDGLANWVSETTAMVEFEEYVGVSERSINAALIKTFSHILTLPGIEDATGGYDIYEKELIFMVAGDDLNTASIEARIERSTDFDVSVYASNGSLGSDDTVNGGGRLEILGGESLACTSGFGIAKGAQLGVVTAGHCPDSVLTYEDWSGQPEVQIGSRAAQYIGDLGDMQIHLFGSTSTDDIYVNSSHNLIDISGVLIPINGIQLCRYGANSGRECSETYSQGHCKTVQDIPVCNLTMMNTNEAGPGDSGGPWFASTYAYGIHQGEKFWWGAKDVFTRASNFNLAFGGIIRTQ